MAKIHFLGAAGTVTGSKHLVEWRNGTQKRILVDCGIFQGLKELRLKNWEEFPIDPSSIDAILITHAHIDHIGFLPKLVHDGYRGPVYGTLATCDLAEIMLRDSAHIQEEDAKHARKYGFSKHKDPKPLYTLEDAEQALALFKPLPYNAPVSIFEGASVYMRHAGHVLGSAFIELTIEENGESTKIVFSGDVGRYNQPLLLDPDPPASADYLLLECTYGNRLHKDGDPKGELADIIYRTAKRGGTVVIPAFALGRSQKMLQFIAELIDEGSIEPIDVFLDSPMAVSTTWQTRAHHEELDAHTLSGIRSNSVFKRSEFHYLSTREQSQKLNERMKPCIIISASGMATAGRVLHHLARTLPHDRNTIVLVGYQAEGSRGRLLQEGAEKMKIHGQQIPVKAEVVTLSAMSGHADYSEMMPWLKKMDAPIKTFLVHGEKEGLEAMSSRLNMELNWETYIPSMGEVVDITPSHVQKASPKGKHEVEERKPVHARGAIALVLENTVWQSSFANMPGTVIFREEPSTELAGRIAQSHLFSEAVILASKKTEKASDAREGFIEMLKKHGIHTWVLSEG